MLFIRMKLTGMVPMKLGDGEGRKVSLPPMFAPDLGTAGQNFQSLPPIELVIIGQKMMFRLNSSEKFITFLSHIVLFCLNRSYFVLFGHILSIQVFFVLAICYL